MKSTISASHNGRDEATGEPLSDKKATTAAKLQVFLGLLGAGRFYIGSFKIGFRQLGLGIVGFVLAQVTAHADTASGFVGMLLFGGIVWGFGDAARMLRRTIPDGQGRKLR
ncbi:MAG: TM2 domain-containing protein [Mycobacterium sp.]|uniref:TM2 domain-containing protein n=1 Tax=Mycobacterium sp. TaxID=1785 RepID=UPI003BAFAAB0